MNIYIIHYIVSMFNKLLLKYNKCIYIIYIYLILIKI